MLLLILISISVLATVTFQCAPHAPSRPWTNNTSVNNHHHHSYQSYFLDNRTIYNKLIQIEKRIENIEKKENILPPPPPSPPAPAPETEPEKPKEQPGEQTEEQENNDCLACKSSKPMVSDDCENCLSVSVSSPFPFFPCSAVSVKCENGARKLKLSEDYQIHIFKNDFVISCQEGNWIMMVNNKEHKVDAISCLSK